MSGPVSSAIISQLVSGATSFLTDRYSSNVQELIDRLVIAQIQLESVLLESEKFDINNDEPLHKWKEKFKEAMCEAEEVTINFILREEPNQTIEGGHTASNLTEAITRQDDLQANLPHDQPMQEEGSDDATLVHTASNLTEAVIRRIELQANSPHDQPMQEEGSDGATLVHPSLNLLKAVTRRLGLQLGSPILYKLFSSLFKLERLWQHHYEIIVSRIGKFAYFSDLPLRERKKLSWAINIARALKSRSNWQIYPCKKWLNEYLENDKNVSKLKNTVEKLEKMAGNIGNFIKLLELQKKRKMNRKRKRSGVALQGFFLVISLKLQTYALFCYREDPYLLVIMLFCANCTVPTAITGDIFIM